MEMLSVSMVDSAVGSVDLALGLVGVMTFFLGLMKVAESGGLLTIVARLIRPLMVRLFPSVPADHPAMGSMILNMSANALGLGNAATPFGIRAMQELDRLNPVKGTATDAMVLFLAINTSNVTLLPTGVIAIRAAAGSHDPEGILPTTLFATFFSTIIAIIAAKVYGKLSFFKRTRPDKIVDSEAFCEDVAPDILSRETEKGYPLWVSGIAMAILISFIPITVLFGRTISPWIIPGLMLGFLTFGIFRKVPIYEVFVEGAKEGYSGRYPNYPLSGGHPGGRGDAPRQRCHGPNGQFSGSMDGKSWNAGGCAPHGYFTSPFRIRCLWSDGLYHQ